MQAYGGIWVHTGASRMHMNAYECIWMHTNAYGMDAYVFTVAYGGPTFSRAQPDSEAQRDSWAQPYSRTQP